MGTPLCNSVVSNSFENCLPRYAYPVYEPIQSLRSKEVLGKILGQIKDQILKVFCWILRDLL